ncbi:hypothetical protein DENIS_0311 [Desulfonema ishimotonii]|uniref:site-specific DNA-methyltransferase (adenine-specific) n=1 Tax=Desulfonema ishimotonii TaxID=45657 RepID=A0A401FQY1_9BACT|nr:DNA methyltransferase [Desulfonema ishimotonii]GBC59372.1 hypothetical protein DENIS_0311 [Desulfonema ishimotonii]
MSETCQQLFTDNFLTSVWKTEYADYLEKRDGEILAYLRNWSEKGFQKETESEGAFADIFFKKIWGYAASGETAKDDGYTCHPQFPIPNAGQKGGTGKADMALGYFGGDDAVSKIPQVLCEFKDIRSGLDNEQNRKGNKRSPVRQCADYLREANNAFAPYGHEPVRAKWAIVTDMNEFRLYHRQSIPHRYQKFVITPPGAETAVPLTEESDRAAMQRFFFWKMFQPFSLLSVGGSGPLEKLMKNQLILEKELEKDFYREYHAYREKVFRIIVAANPDFRGTKGRLVRMTQRFLDRCLFIMFCEDMGAALNYPPNLLRDVLIKHSLDEFYDPDGNMAWEKVRKLFAAMRDGTPFLKHPINRFNGGLFAEEPEMESLTIPTILFCAEHQGTNEETLFSEPKTLLYLSAKYNFGTKAATEERSIGLYTLGRIFEQSITDLEFMEARADGRVSLTELSKRKRDGVYYTPEWVTDYIVAETVGAKLEDIRAELGFDALPPVTDENIGQYLARQKDKRKKAVPHVSEYLSLLDQYADALNDVKIVDPACGSGAFLIQAFERLFRERQWIASEKERIERKASLFDMEREMKAVLSDNLFGVDINPESVEITRLALWLRTALPDKPLEVLDDNILCGNSLVGPDFYRNKSPELFPDEEKERINVFDWQAAFPGVFEKGGFDCVIGNPPYIKLQHFKKAMPEVTEYLLTATKADGSPKYESTRTGNFDMYLPFIEMGTELLNENGRMGYIAPNVWIVSDYGKGLRKKIHREGKLTKWIDFKSFQVFSEAITYTSLQFYSGSPQKSFNCYFAGDGNIACIDLNNADETVKYDEIEPEKVWNLVPRSERKFLASLDKRFIRLGDIDDLAVGFRGIETGADYLYQFRRIGHGQYHHAKGKDQNKIFEFEDQVMKPLVSGPEAERYTDPLTNTYVIFPYEIIDNSAVLISADKLSKNYPKTWNYFKANEELLRVRDKGKMRKKAGWYGYTRPMNLEKMDKPKLGISETVTKMAVFYDSKGEIATNNVRVGGILAKDHNEARFTQAILNAPVCDFVFKRIAKSKNGGYYEANKQYLLPLPIPKVNDDEKIKLAEMAKVLQELHTKRRNLLLAIDKRLDSSQIEKDKRKPQWLWADANNKKATEKRLEALSAYLRPGVTLKAENDNGEIRLLINDIPVIEGVFEDEDQAEFITAQWNRICRATNITEKFTAKKLVSLLCGLRKTDNPALMKQVVKFDAEIRELEREIDEKEAEINMQIYGLYGLSPEEIQMIESDKSRISV